MCCVGVGVGVGACMHVYYTLSLVYVSTYYTCMHGTYVRMCTTQ